MHSLCLANIQTRLKFRLQLTGAVIKTKTRIHDLVALTKTKSKIKQLTKTLVQLKAQSGLKLKDSCTR